MEWLVAVFVSEGVKDGKYKTRNEYREFMELDDAKAYADNVAEKARGDGLDYDIRIYQLTNY